MATGLMKDASAAVKALPRAFAGKAVDPEASIGVVVAFAETARREGLLALEEAAKSVEDPFLRKGIELAVDGTDPEELREILAAEIHSKKQEDKVASKFFGDMDGLPHTLGIIGPVMGLLPVPANLPAPDTLAPPTT